MLFFVLTWQPISPLLISNPDTQFIMVVALGDYFQLMHLDALSTPCPILLVKQLEYPQFDVDMDFRGSQPQD